MACPVCKSNYFYVKDPGDPFEIYEFEYINDGMQFVYPEAAANAPEIKEDSEIYCQRCSWHGNTSKVR